VEYLGSYNPHTKQAQLNKEGISDYLKNGAQPSDRVAKLIKKEGIKLPGWVTIAPDKKRGVRNPDKRRATRPVGKPEPEKMPETEAVADEPKSQAEPQVETAGEELQESTENAVDQAATQSEAATPETESTGDESAPES
jgi:small subunit ribosomal protein S16